MHDIIISVEEQGEIVGVCELYAIKHLPHTRILANNISTPRIEPESPGWSLCILPLDYTVVYFSSTFHVFVLS